MAKRCEVWETTARAEGWASFAASRVEWSLAVRNFGTAAADLVAMDRAMVAFHRATGRAAMPNSAQARGCFDRSGGALDPTAARAYDDPRNRDTAAMLETIAAAHGATPTQVMVAGLLRLPFPVVPVIGPCPPEQVASRWAAMSLAPEDGRAAAPADAG